MRTDWPWESVKALQDRGILRVEDGNHGEYRPRPHEFVEDGTTFIRAADIIDGRVAFDRASRINDEAMARIRKGVGQPGDVLFSHKGTVGKIALAPMTSPPFVCSPQTTFWRTLREDVLDRHFLHSYMRSREFINQWWVRKGDTDMADYVSLTAQRQLLVPLPPLAIQHKIAAVLSAYDDLIANNTRRIEILEEMARAIYREWFVEFRCPGHEEVRMVESEMGPMPSGWQQEPLAGLLDSYLGGDWGTEEPTEDNPVAVSVIRGTDIPKLKVGDVSTAPTRFISQRSFAKRALRPGDLVVENSVNASSRPVGRSLLITDGILDRLGGKAICASFCKNFRTRGPTDAVLLKHHLEWLRTEGLMEEFTNVAANGIGNFQAQRFVASTSLAMPTDQEERTSLVTPLVACSRSVLADQVGVLRLSRDLLLPKLVSGEVDVSDLDIDLGGVAA